MQVCDEQRLRNQWGRASGEEAKREKLPCNKLIGSFPRSIVHLSFRKTMLVNTLTAMQVTGDQYSIWL